MRSNEDARLLKELRRHARNMLKIRAISSCREAQEFQELIRARLLEKEKDLRVCLTEIMEAAELRLKRADQERDLMLCEYFRAILADITFIMTAIDGLFEKNTSAI